ncbi:MAG: 50S ribosomal protein L11 methyltransferase [Chloroflexi bacterium]|nr:50S ribosomal protein L11 methyltransferase [Chloroflexota bacterium]
MHWLEISLILDPELAEPVADALAPYAHQGVSIESTAIEASAEDEGRAVGPLRVRAYLPADDPEALENTKQKIEESLFYLNMIRPIPSPVYTPVADADWAELWRASYKPIRVGNRLLVIPSWLADDLTTQPADANHPTIQPPSTPAIPILIDPGMAFGTGTHPTTQLCLALLETHLNPDDTVLDLGCGSGILAIAAAKLGAKSALAVDIEDESIRATKENAELNGVAASIETLLGSLADVQLSNLQPFNTTVANIIAPVIIRLLGQGLGQTIAQNGVLIVSGILAEQAGEVKAALNRAGLTDIDRKQMGDWVAIAATRK